ncbi:MAG: hypothetical protein WA705_30330 [Candidatus Ozemobacteraceae bacterium]
MKSKLFCGQNYLGNPNFQRDIAILKEATPENLRKLPKIALKALLTNNHNERLIVRTELHEELMVSEKEASSYLDIAEFFIRAFSDGGEAFEDNPEEILEDLINELGFSESKREFFREFLGNSRNLGRTQGSEILLKRAHSLAVLPSVAAISSEIDIRVLFSDSYNGQMPVLNFSPKPIGIIPLALISLTLSGSNQSSIVFQADLRTLDAIIDHFKGIKKQISEAEKIKI